MAEIPYNKFKSHLKDAFSPAPVYLIFGEEYLYKSIYGELVNAIVPEKQKDFSLEELDGTDDNAFEAIERLNTFSLDAGTKVIGFIDTNIFYAKDDSSTIVQRLKRAITESEKRKSADLFLKLLSLMDISFETMTADDRQRILQIDAETPESDSSWLDTVINYCRDQNARSTAVTDAVTALTTAIEKGFAPGNHLIITAETIDKRRKLYKTINDKGIIIDCSVPSRDTRADKARQETALLETMHTVLDPKGKTLAPDGFAALRDMIGFNLREFHNSLEKLAAFTDERRTITTKDVTTLMKRTKKDPVYELTGALFDKDVAKALFLLESLLGGAEPMHPLQVIAAIVNQTRKLLIIRDFMDKDRNKAWRPGLPFDRFKQTTLPAIEKYDAGIREHLNRQEEFLTAENTGKKSKKKKAPASDLTISPNPSSPFPAYQNFKKAGIFSTRELIAALKALTEADRQLKSSRVDQRLILEHLIIRIARSDIQAA